MIANEKKSEVAFCTRCGQTTDKWELINQRCKRVIQNKKCKGVYRSDLTPWVREDN